MPTDLDGFVTMGQQDSQLVLAPEGIPEGYRSRNSGFFCVCEDDHPWRWSIISLPVTDVKLLIESTHTCTTFAVYTETNAKSNKCLSFKVLCKLFEVHYDCSGLEQPCDMQITKEEHSSTLLIWWRQAWALHVQVCTQVSTKHCQLPTGFHFDESVLHSFWYLGLSACYPA